MSALVDLGGFQFRFPLWTIVFEKEFVAHDVPRGVVVLNDLEHGSFFPLYTDRGQAERQIAAEPEPAKSPVSLDLEETRRCLVAFAKTRGRYVGINTAG